MGKTIARKRKLLNELARHRQEHVPAGYRGIGEYHAGAYECDFVSPYTKSAQNLAADIMLVLQDWCADEFLRGPVDPEVIALGHDPRLPTNRNLKRLLWTHFGTQLAETYATNLFPFIKPGGMSASVSAGVLAEAAATYTVPEIKLVEPKLVVCFGKAVCNAIRKSLGLRIAGDLGTAIASPFQINDAEVWVQSHPGSLGRNNRNQGGVDRVSQDWQRMSDAILHGASPGTP